MSRRTNAKIEFGLVDVKAKEDSTLSVSDKQPFSNIEQIEQERLEFKKYATGEPNLWLLNGTADIFPDNTTGIPLGWWSSKLSQENGSFAVPPVLTMAFAQNHSSIGLTLHFYYSEWANEINVKWYNGGTLLSEKTEFPNSNIYAVSSAVENYTKIVITFFGTNHPFRYLKLTSIDYGIAKIFGENELMSASTAQEINPISEEITINTLDFQVHSSDAEFSIINPKGIYRYLQQRQPLTVYETLNNVDHLMGIYYLEGWEGKNENTFTMSAVDAIGIMDGTLFDGGMYTDVTCLSLISAILEDGGFDFYEVDSSIASIKLSGWLPVSTHRDVLQQVAFAVCAVVDTSRSDLVRVYPALYAPSGTIERTRKFTDGTVALKPLITGVEVTEHNFIQSGAATVGTLFEGILSVGQNKVTFSDPAYSLSVSGATIVTTHVNYAIVNVTTEQKVTVSGKKYVDSTRISGKYTPSLPAGEKLKVLTVEDATLVGRSNSARVAQAVFDYHQKRIQQSFTFQVSEESPGESYDVQTLYGQTKSGLMEAMTINLTGGFIGKAVVTGG